MSIEGDVVWYGVASLALNGQRLVWLRLFGLVGTVVAVSEVEDVQG